jgi:hypothetical protein
VTSGSQFRLKPFADSADGIPRGEKELLVPIATASDGDCWSKYYRDAAERRSQQGGDPLKRVLKRYILRQRCFLAGSSLVLVGLVTIFVVVLMR